jgi:hypothetical protein
MSTESSVLIDIMFIVVGVLMASAFAIGVVLVIRDTIRQRGNWGINLRPGPCLQCGAPMPMIRKPENWRQAMWGGWRCPECSLELDRWGRPVEGQVPGKWAVLRAVEEIDKREHRPRSQDDRIQNVNDQTQRGDAS